MQGTSKSKRSGPKRVAYGTATPAKPKGAQPGLTTREKDLIAEIYNRYEVFKQGCAEAHNWAKLARRIALLDDPLQDAPGTPEEQKALQLQTLKSTLNNMVADQMDNMPEAFLRPERPELAQVAEDLTDVIRFVLDENDYEAVHRERVEDCFVTGTSVLQVLWDESMDGGTGNVSIIRWPIEGLLWDPMAETIQDARAVMKISWHPLSWYKGHFSEAAPYIGPDVFGTSEVGVPDAWKKKTAGEEDMAMLIEYWYRLFDADTRTYAIHVAYAAGRALLYCSEKEHPKGLYKHGQYPFVLDVFTKVRGMPVGVGVVSELAPMQRYINRYYHYFDVNMRMAAKGRLLVNRNSQIDLSALSDWNTDIIQGNAIDDKSVHWLQTQLFTGAATGVAIQLQTDMKQDSGQNQFTRGETAGGVTAASAIASLQEAGNKTTRLRTGVFQQGFKRVVEQVLWLVAQFYTRDKARMIVGADRMPRMIAVDAERVYNGDPEAPERSEGLRAMQTGGLPPETRRPPTGKPTGRQETATGGANPAKPFRSPVSAQGVSSAPKRTGPMSASADFPPPPYNIQIQVQRRNPLRVQAFNEIVMKVYEVMLQNGQPFPASALFRLLEIEGKDRLLPAIDANEQFAQQMAGMNAALEQATAQNQQLMEANKQLQATLRQQTAAMAGSRGTSPESMSVRPEGGPSATGTGGSGARPGERAGV